MKKILYLLTISSLVVAQETPEVKSPQEVQLELDQAQRDFEIAQKMFIPYYIGPLITGSAHTAPKGVTNMQVYVYFDWAYARFNNSRKSINTPTVFTFQPLGLIQRGLTNWLDFTVVADGFLRQSQGIYGRSFGDMSTSFGIQVLKETPTLPSIKVSIGEGYPTGKFRNLNPARNGLDAGGDGVFVTIVGLNVSKVFWQVPLHPIAWRFSSTY